MFEGKQPFGPDASKSPVSESHGVAKHGAQLNTLSWGDLVAKLEAARDLRREFASEDDSPRQPDIASFDADCAHRLAEQQETFSANYKLPVNLENSGNRKDNAGNKGLEDNANDRLARGSQ